MNPLIHQITHCDPIHLAIAAIDRLAINHENHQLLQEIHAAEIQHQNRPVIIEVLSEHFKKLTLKK